MPNSEELINKIIEELIKIYGPIFIIIVIVFFILIWIIKIIIENNLKNNFEKKFTNYKTEIENKYVRDIENYKLFIQKQHVIYDRLAKLLVHSEGKIYRRRLKDYPDFSLFSLKEIQLYLKKYKLTEEKNNFYLSFFSNKKELKKQLQELENKLEIFNAGESLNLLSNYKLENLIFVSNEVEKEINKIISLMRKSLLIQEYPSNGEFLNKKESEDVEELEKEFHSLIEKTIQIMKKELSVGLVN